MKKTIENKKVLTMIPVILFLLSSTLMAANDQTFEEKATRNSSITQNNHAMRMNQDQQDSKAISENISIKTKPSIIVYVNGMVCSFCAQGLTKSFEKHKSIKTVAVNLDSKTVSLRLKRFRRISNKKIRSIINDAGYNVEEIIRQ